MSDPTTGAYAPANSPGDSTSTAKQVAHQGAQAAGQAGAEIKDTAAGQAQRVASEAKTQVQNVASDVRDKLGEQARSQNDRLVAGIREAASGLDEMRGDRADSPAATVVSRVADGGRQLADYLDHHGPDGVLREVQDFARRRPGAFLATALAAGFVVGRLGKSVAKADPQAGKPSTDSFTSGTPGYSTSGTPGYPTSGTPGYATSGAPGYTTPTTGYETPATGTGYEPGYVEPATTYPPATTSGTGYVATGTGTPAVVEEEIVVREPRP